MLNTHLVKSWLRHILTAKSRHGLHSPFMYRLADKVIYDKRHYPDYDLIEKERRRLLEDKRLLTLTDLGAGSQYGNRKQKKVSALAATALKSPRLAQLIYRLARDICSGDTPPGNARPGIAESDPGSSAPAMPALAKPAKPSTLATSALAKPAPAPVAPSPRTVLELGTCLGITTGYLASACPDARVITIEGCPETAAVAREVFDRLAAAAPPGAASGKVVAAQASVAPPLSGARNGRIESLTGNFDEVLPQLLGNLSSLDILFIDGNHRKEATLNYFEWCLPVLHENSLVIFDDIHWSKGMEEAWERIKAHPAVTVSADLFHIGLVFLRKGQVKEHFTLRY